MDYHADDFAPPEGSLVFSTTSIGVWRSCKRKWYLEHALKVPYTQDKTAFTLGSVVHACLERYLLCPTGDVPPPSKVPDQPFGDDGCYARGSALYGQMPGRPVKLFPPDWWVHIDRDGSVHSINETEQATAKLLVTRAIEQGVIQHLSGGQVEHRFWHELAEGIWLTSLVDYRSKSSKAIEDHKTIGNMKYAKTPGSLHEDSQQKIYAGVSATEWGLDPADTISVSHNTLEKKFPNRVKKIETQMTAEYATGYLDQLGEELQEAVALKAEEPYYEDVPMSRGTCDAYGPKHLCYFYNLCHPPNPFAMTQNTNFSGTPNPRCPVCKGAGVAKFGNVVCPLCVRQGLITPTEGQAPAQAPAAVAPAPQVAAQTQAQPVAPAPAPTPAPAAAPAAQPAAPVAAAPAAQPQAAPAGAAAGTVPQVVAQTAPDVTEPAVADQSDEPTTVGQALMRGDFPELLATYRTGKEPGKRGRPAARMTMVIDAGVTSVKEGRSLHHLSTYVTAVIPQWPMVFGVSYEDDDTWKRRERLASMAFEISEAVGDGVLVADSGDYRLGPLIASLTPYADAVIKGSK